jgi:Flp pilus assembly protein TadG
MAARLSRGLRSRSATGAAVVEFALLVPVLLLIVFGIIQYGFYFWAMQGGSDIARSAARSSAAGNPATCAAFQAGIRDQINSLTGTGSGATVSRSYSSAPPDVKVGDIVTVHVEFTSFDLHLPFLPFVHDGLVSSSAQARVDYVPAQPETCS